MSALLEARGLRVTFGGTAAVRGTSLTVEKGETHCLVGESGCGKSVTALAIMGLLAKGGRREAEVLSFAGQDIRNLGEREMSRLRGDRMAMIFQEPMTSLNTAFTAGEQVAEALRLHEGLNARDAMGRAIAMLERVRIPDAARRARQYPHQLSGGMRQRVMIAIALACKPRLLIADEPTTALDVTVQAQILALLDELKRETGTAVVLITHDLGVVRDHADDVVVMYAGRVAERAPTAALFDRPEHPYTIGLLGAAPRLDSRRARLASIEGTVPDLRNPPPGCRFAPRCPFALAVCEVIPPLAELAEGHWAACHRAPLDAVIAA
jgi:peptide/nickel transport system ATP-binding protein